MTIKELRESLGDDGKAWGLKELGALLDLGEAAEKMDILLELNRHKALAPKELYEYGERFDTIHKEIKGALAKLRCPE